MNIAPVAYRYARSLISLAKEQGTVKNVQEDMQLVSNTCIGSHELTVLLKSPVVKADKKAKVLGKIFGGRIGEMTTRFIGILIRKGREAMLPQVAAAFNELYKLELNIVTAEVASAVALSEDARPRYRKTPRKDHRTHRNGGPLLDRRRHHTYRRRAIRWQREPPLERPAPRFLEEPLHPRDLTPP